MSDNSPTLYERIGGASVIHQLVDSFYSKVLDDYRLNRFFNTNNVQEQTETFNALLVVLTGGSVVNAEAFHTLLDNYFMAAFARSKRKSFVGGSDFGFFGYIIEQDHPSTNYLCDGHSHLLKFMPEDSHYDVIMEHLTSTLRQYNFDNTLINNVLQLAERGRNPVLGK